MIELRWLERIVPHAPNIGRTDRVLQYRESRSVNLERALYGDCNGVEWRDVPTVKDDPAEDKSKCRGG